MLKKFKKMVLFIAGIALILFLMILYFSGFIQASIHEYDNPGSIGTIITSISENGWPASFWLMVIITVIGSIYTYARFFSRLKRQDKIGRKFFTPKGTMSYGEAHFAEPEEYKDMARIVPIERAQGVILGQLTKDGSQCISMRTDYNRANRNIAVVGGSGSGKSYTFTNNCAYQFARRQESVVFTDPDGGLYRDLHGFFENRGYVVKCLNLRDFDESNCWNCLGSIGNGDIEQNVSVFAETIVQNAAGDAEQIYIDGQKQLLKALLLRVFLGTDFSEDEKNIRTVYDLLMHENLRDFLSNLFSESSSQPYQRIYMKPWRASCNGSQNLVGNIMTNLSTTLEVFQSDKLCDLLSYDDIDLALPGDRPCAYFCIFPDYHQTYSFICSLFFAMFFQTLITKADKNPNGKLATPVNFVLDEFPNIGAIPDWGTKMSVIRKRNITAIMIFQQLTQLELVYGETAWNSIWGNCATKIILGSSSSDHETAKWVVDRLGTTTIEVETTQHAQNESPIFLGIRAKRLGEGQRELMSVSEIEQMNIDDLIIILGENPPIYAHKVPHILHPYSKELCESPLGPLPPINDAVGRAQRAEREKELLEKWAHDSRNGADFYTEEQLDEMALAPGDVVKGSLKLLGKTAVDKIKKVGSKAATVDDDSDAETFEFIDLDDTADFLDTADTTEQTIISNLQEDETSAASVREQQDASTTRATSAPTDELENKGAAKTADAVISSPQKPAKRNNEAEQKSVTADGTTLVGSAVLARPAKPDSQKKKPNKTGGASTQKQNNAESTPTPTHQKPTYNARNDGTVYSSRTRSGSVIMISTQFLSDAELAMITSLYREGQGATAMKSSHLPV